MTLSNLLLSLAIGDAGSFCQELGPVLRLVGIVILAVKIGVPIILIVVGMFGLTKAVTEKDEKAVKEAQKGLVSKAIAAVMVFLVATIVSVLMNLVGASKYQDCMTCINDPFSCETGSD